MLLEEALGDIDNSAKEELDGFDNVNELNVTNDGYDLNDVINQLNGMINKWFKLASSMSEEKKSNFLKLGDRLDEITKVLETEFI